MRSPEINLHITITDAEADGEQLEMATRYLITELRDMGVESISRTTAPSPESTMGGASFAPGAMDVTILPGFVNRLYDTLIEWINRKRQRTVKIETPTGFKIEFTPDKALSPTEMLAFIQALQSGEQTVPAPATVPDTMFPYRISLRELLVAHFNAGELQTLCFHLTIPYEELCGENLNEKMIALIEYAERHKRMDDLLRVGARLRPEVQWPRVGAIR